MTTRARIAWIAAAVAVVIVAIIVLSSNDDKKETSSNSTSTPGATTPATTGSGKPAKPAPPPVTQIVVKGGQPAGGIKTITVDKGDQIRFAVSSDVSDEVHVHGYDFMKDVEAGGKVSFSFPAKIDGEFEVELESRAVQIAKLVVNP
jgi:heme/copper-type cytochrome/quinol oxidase subunit 2